MNFRHLKYFLTVATELNITRAAELLHISQPALSSQISELERSLGVQLIIRTRRPIQLTPAGKALLSEGKAFLEYEARLCRRVREAESASPGKLSIGYTGAIETNGLPALVSRFRREYPDVTLNLRRMTWNALMGALGTQEVDAGLLTVRQGDELPFENEVLFSDTACLVVNGEHPLANLRSAGVSMLTGLPFLIESRTENPVVFRALQELFRGTGTAPFIAGEHPMIEAVLMLVQAGEGVTFLSSQISSKVLLGLRSIPIEEAPRLNLVAAWRDGGSRYLASFIRMARAVKWSHDDA